MTDAVCHRTRSSIKARCLSFCPPCKIRPATFTSATTATTVPSAATTAIAACENCCSMLPYLPRLNVRCNVREYVCMYVCKVVRKRRVVATARTMQNIQGKYGWRNFVSYQKYAPGTATFTRQNQKRSGSEAPGTARRQSHKNLSGPGRLELKQI